jgi:hypothetical protein
MMNDRITSALKQDAAPPVAETTVDAPTLEEAPDSSRTQAITTEEELQAFYIVKAILAGGSLDLSKITYKDTLNYFSVLFNGMANKWVCRFRFSVNKKYIGLPNDAGEEVRHEITKIDDIYGFKENLLASAQRFFNASGA